MNFLLISSICLAALGSLTTIRDSIFEEFLRWLWLGPILDFCYKYYAFLFAFFGAIAIASRFGWNKYIVGGSFVVIFLFFKFALGL